jgi:hypothetical protein
MDGPKIANGDIRPRRVSAVADYDPNDVEGRGDKFSEMLEFANRLHKGDVVYQQKADDALAAWIGKNFTRHGKTITYGNIENKAVQTDELFNRLNQKPDSKELQAVLKETKSIVRKDKLVEYDVRSLAANLRKYNLVSNDILASVQQLNLSDMATYIGSLHTKHGLTANSGPQIKEIESDFEINPCSEKWTDALNKCNKYINKRTRLVEYKIGGNDGFVAASFGNFDKDGVAGLSKKEFLAATAALAQES